jgi:hypothetical protein
VSELDLGLKVGVRRLLWAMGHSTRLDVELRGERRPLETAVPERRQRRGGYETFTDLDVLGVLTTPGFRVTTTIADCKSGARDKPTARMFWARGVADLFGADQVMLVREHDVNDGTRQLSGRLGISVLTARDLLTMQNLYSAPARSSSPLEVLFDKETVAAHLSAFNSLDRRLSRLVDFRNFDYWVNEPHRNVMQLMAHMSDVRRLLEPRNPAHLALFVDLAWMFTLSLIRALNYAQGAFVNELDRGLQEYLFGGARDLREKRELAALLQTVAPEGSKKRDHLPEYYPALLELSARLLRRPDEVQCALRYAELTSALMAAKQSVTLSQVFREDFRPVAAKLLADVCGFLVSAATLNPEFRQQARAWLLGEDTPVERRREAPADSVAGLQTGPARASDLTTAATGDVTNSPTNATDFPPRSETSPVSAEVSGAWGQEELQLLDPDLGGDADEGRDEVVDDREGTDSGERA